MLPLRAPVPVFVTRIEAQQGGHTLQQPELAHSKHRYRGVPLAAIHIPAGFRVQQPGHHQPTGRIAGEPPQHARQSLLGHHHIRIHHQRSIKRLSGNTFQQKVVCLAITTIRLCWQNLNREWEETRQLPGEALRIQGRLAVVDHKQCRLIQHALLAGSRKALAQSFHRRVKLALTPVVNHQRHRQPPARQISHWQPSPGTGAESHPLGHTKHCALYRLPPAYCRDLSGYSGCEKQ